MSNSLIPARERNWFGHPRGLSVLFLTEMWEMFSFFGMRAILVYYMTKHLDMGQEYASLVYGAYAAFVYFTPVFGGMVADRWLGKRNAVMIGGAAMALGHFMMSSEALFYPALATIALGNGLFLPSLASQIEGLYRDGDVRSKSAYNIYYVGINLGGFLAPLVCGTLGESYGWHWGFAAAGFGMLLSLVIYLAGRRYLPPEPARGAAIGLALQGLPQGGHGLLGLALHQQRAAFPQPALGLRRLALLCCASQGQRLVVATGVERGLHLQGQDVAVVGPKGLPPEIVGRLNKLANEFLASPDVRAKLQDISVRPIGGTPEALGKFVQAEIAKWRPIVEPLAPTIMQ